MHIINHSSTCIQLYENLVPFKLKLFCLFNAYFAAHLVIVKHRVCRVECFTVKINKRLTDPVYRPLSSLCTYEKNIELNLIYILI